MQTSAHEIRPTLLTRSEIEWIRKKTALKSIEYMVKSRTRSQFKTLTNLEIPLLVEKGA